MKISGEYVCDNCKLKIGPEYKNEFYRIKFSEFCSLNCFYEKDQKHNVGKELVKALTEATKDIKVQNRTQTNKGNKRKNTVHQKSSKQKTRKNKR